MAVDRVRLADRELDRKRLTSRVRAQVRKPLAPTFTLATTSKPVPVVPGMSTTPGVGGPDNARATMSGVTTVDAVNKSMFVPIRGAWENTFDPEKSNATSVDEIGAVGKTEMMKLCDPPGGMATRTFGDPVI